MRILVIAGFVLFVLSVTIPFTSLASTHPCAFPTPPQVADPLVQPTSVAGNLFINEVLLNPHATWNCSETNGTFSTINDTWVEIYNSQNVSYDLNGVHAALDSGPGTDPFYFPLGSAIAAHSFLVVFPLTGSSLFSMTTTLRLQINGIAVDTVVLPMPTGMSPDTSYGCMPDGCNFACTSPNSCNKQPLQAISIPTIGMSNPSSKSTVTSSPTPHLTPTKTPTPHTSKKSSSSSSSQNTSAAGGQTDSMQTPSTTLTLIDGNQPTWNKMPMPGIASPSPIATPRTRTATATSAVQAPKTDSADITTKKIAITLVAIALAGSLTWCWKLFTTLDSRKQKG